MASGTVFTPALRRIIVRSAPASVGNSGPLPLEDRPSLPIRLTVWGVLSVAITLLVLSFSFQHGRLTTDITYDDVGYMLGGMYSLQRFYDLGMSGLLHAYATYPPHSPVFTMLAFVGYALFGMHDWAPYAISGLIVFAALCSFDRLLRGTPFWLKCLLQLFVLSVPILPLAVFEFRPDVFAGLMSAISAMLLLEGPLASREGRDGKRVLLSGTLLGLAILTKPPTFPATVVLGGLALLAVTGRDWLLKDRQTSWSDLAKGWARYLLPAVLVPLPHFLLCWRDIFDYIYVNVFGANKALWQLKLNFWENFTWYGTGPGGAMMLGSHLALAGAAMAVALVVALSRPGRLEPRRLLNVICFALITSVSYAIPTLNWHKHWFFATPFDFLLIAGAVVSLRWVALSATTTTARRIAAGSVALFSLGGFYFAQWPPLWGLRGHPASVARNKITHDIYENLRSRSLDYSNLIWLTSGGFITPETLGYMARRDGNPMCTSADLFETFQGQCDNIENAVEVLAAEPGNPDVAPHLPATEMLGQTLAFMRSRRDFVQVATFPATDKTHHYYLFERVGSFCGWDHTTGLAPREGPYPDLGIPRIRWGLGPKTELYLADRPAGAYRLQAREQSFAVPQDVTVRLDGQLIMKQTLTTNTGFDSVDLPLSLTSGSHVISIGYTSWDSSDPGKLAAVAFSQLRVVPANAQAREDPPPVAPSGDEPPVVKQTHPPVDAIAR